MSKVENKSCRSKQRKNVYFAPAGQLHNIAIEHLPSSDSTFIAEQINFYRVVVYATIGYDKRQKPY